MSSLGATLGPSRSRLDTGFVWLWAGAVAILAICVIALIWVPIQRIGSLPAINYNEGWNAYRQWMASEGQPLYGAPPSLWITNYPFLSFHIVGLLGGVTGSVLVAGRIIALASLLAICASLAGIVRIVAGSWRGGLYAGLCFFLWVATFTPNRLAMDDPALLASAIALFGVYAYVRAPASLPWLIVSALAFAISVFTKQDVIALPLAVGLHLLATRNWRGLAVWIAVGAIAAGLLLLLTFHLDGRYFFAHLLRPRVYAFRQEYWVMRDYFQRFYAPLALCTAVLLWDRNIPRRDLLLALLVVAHAVAIAFVGGNGVDYNIFYEAMIAAAAACAVAICYLERVLPATAWARAVLVFALAVPALPGVMFAPGQLYTDLAAKQHLPALTRAAQRSIALLRQVHGPVICEDVLLCYDAGKPLGYDPYFVKDQIGIGRINEADILAMLASHRYAAVEIGTFGNPASSTRAERLRFTRAFMQTLRAEYRPVLSDPIHSVFMPRQ